MSVEQMPPELRVVQVATDITYDDARWQLVRLLDSLDRGAPAAQLAHELRAAASRLEGLDGRIDHALELLSAPTIGAVRRQDRQDVAA